MDNRIKWKETIGDIVKRPGEYNLWGYRLSLIHIYVKMYYERIPDGEIAKNEKLKQNPYYN